MSNAYRLRWDDDYGQIMKDATDTVYLLTTGGFDGDEQQSRLAQMDEHFRIVAAYQYATCDVRGYVPLSA